MKKLLLAFSMLTACELGKPGPAGADGAAGERGPAGESLGQITSKKMCSVSSNGLVFYHTIITYDTNDRYVSCSITDDNHQYTNAGFYESNQIGALNSLCILNYDLEDDGTGGYWLFKDVGLSHVTYYNVGSPANELTVSIVNCDVFEF